MLSRNFGARERPLTLMETFGFKCVPGIDYAVALRKRSVRTMRYLAFISYSHMVHSRAHAEALETAVKRYARPFLKAPIAIFRDERVLRPGDSLPIEIRRSLEASEYLIYLASQAAAESKWVVEELRTWCEDLGRKDKLIIIHIQDAIISDTATKSINWSSSDALPSMLKPYVSDIPLWLDLTWAVAVEQRDLRNLVYRNAINALTARLRNITPAEMNDQEILTHKRNVKLRNAAVTAILVLALAAVYNWYQSSENAAALANSISERQVRQAQVALDAGNPNEALARLAQAMRSNPENYVASDRALHLIGTRDPLLLEIVAPTAQSEKLLQLTSSPSAEYAVGLFHGGTIKVWQRDSSLPTWTLNTPEVSSIKVANGHVLMESTNGAMFHLDIRSEKILPLTWLPTSPDAYDINADGSTIAVAKEQDICVASLPYLDSCISLTASAKVTDIAISSDGREVIAASSTKQLWRRDKDELGFREIPQPDTGNYDSLDVFFGPFGAHCAVGAFLGSAQEPGEAAMECIDDNGNTTVDDALTDAVYKPIPAPPEAAYVVADTGLNRLIVGGTGGALATIEVPGIRASGFLAGGSQIYVVSSQNQVSLFNVPTGTRFGMPIRLSDDPSTHVSALGNGLLMIMENGNTYRLSPPDRIGPRDIRVTDIPPTSQPAPDWYGDPTRISTAGAQLSEAQHGDGTWNVQWSNGTTTTVQHPLPKQLDDYGLRDYEWLAHTEASISSNATTLVTGAADGELMIWNARTEKLMGKVGSVGEGSFVQKIHVSQDGGRALIIYASFFDLDFNCLGTGKQRYAVLQISSATPATIGSVLLPTGRNILAVNRDVTFALVAKESDLWLLELVTGVFIPLDSQLSKNHAIRAAFDSKGERVAVATRDGGLHVWDMRTLTPLIDESKFDADPDLHRGMPCEDDYASQIGPLQFSPDSQWVGIQLWRERNPYGMGNDQIKEPFSLTRIGYRLQPLQVRQLADLSERIAGLSYNSNGMQRVFSQLTMTELKAAAEIDAAGVQSLVAALISRNSSLPPTKK